MKNFSTCSVIITSQISTILCLDYKSLETLQNQIMTFFRAAPFVYWPTFFRDHILASAISFEALYKFNAP